ncbi:MAG TPA: hypothetical protein VFD91_07085 [Mariniphaga sp.]|nr:hypothetical protein [Mariniphaga sp.]
MKLVTAEAYLAIIEDTKIADSLPTHELLKSFLKPLNDEHIIFISDLLGVTKYPTSFVDVIMSYEFNTLRLGNITFGEIPNNYAFPLQWLIDLNKYFMLRHPFPFKKLKEQNYLIVARLNTEAIVLDLEKSGIYILAEDLDLSKATKIASNFTEFMNLLFTGILQRLKKSRSQKFWLDTEIALEEDSILFWQSAFSNKKHLH